MTEAAGAQPRPAWGLVLSGGGACGLANIGVLDALEDVGLRPPCIAGSSMGAIVAALYALGHPQQAIHAAAAGLAPMKVVRPSRRPLRGGLHGGLLEQELDAHLGPLVGDATIADCKVPFVCVAGRVREPVRWERMLLAGFDEHVRECIEAVVFPGTTRVMDALLASSAIPVVFSPALVDGDEYVDLVHFGAIPARSLRAACAPMHVIATNTMPTYRQIEPFLPPSVRRFLAAGYEETEQSLAACDLVIRPPLPASMLRFDRAADFIAAGREAAGQRMPEVQALLTRAATPAAGDGAVAR